MKDNKKLIFVLVMLMAVGFAAVSTTLFISGNNKIATNPVDFDVYYSKAYVNGKVDNRVIMDDKHIEFTTTMKSVGDKYELVYDVTNGSYNYDADVTINCTGGNDYVSITNNWTNPTLVESTETQSGKLEVTMIKAYSGDTEIEENVVCTVNAVAKERTTPGTGTPAVKSNENANNEFSGIVKMNDKGTITTVTSGNVVMYSENSKIATLSSDGSFSVDGLENGRHEIYWMNDVDPSGLTKEEIKAQATGSATFVTSTDKKEIILDCINNKCPDGVTYSVKEVEIKPVSESIKLYDLIKSNASSETINFNTNSQHSSTNGIYTTTETQNGSEVYYYRGEVNNNIIFNNMCWKIVRTTETGGVKLLYSGLPVDGKCSATGNDTRIGKSSFNTYVNDNAYIGYMYGSTNATSYEAAHKNTNNSAIKTVIDNWYAANFDSTVTSMIEDAIYCNDRSMVAGGMSYNTTTDDTTYGRPLGYAQNLTIYGAAARSSIYSVTLKPSLKCVYNNDAFTVNKANGNGSLTYPVGLITLDEAVMAGYNTSRVSSYSDYYDETNYLNIDSYYWTMSPIFMYDTREVALGFISSRSIDHTITSVEYGVHPVISLASGILINGKGDGTSDNPYVVKGIESEDTTKTQTQASINLYNEIKSNAKTTTINFDKRSGLTGTNGIYTTTENGSDVYYYRGKVENNIIFNNMCWKIMRTTDTNGIKLIYNGVPVNGTCVAENTDTLIGTTSYSSSIGDNAFIGYMHGLDNYYTEIADDEESSTGMYTTSYTYNESTGDYDTTRSYNLYWGTGYTFDNSTGTFTLTGNIVEGEWSSEFVGYYTCKRHTKTCGSVYYVTAYENETNAKTLVYGYTTNNSKSYEAAHANKADSKIKKYVDDWYSANFTNTNVTSKIEDAIYCNDRSTTSGSNNAALGSSYGTLGYNTIPTAYGAISRSSYYSYSVKPTLDCPNDNDKFTVSSSKGNGKLTYPVGLISTDEVVFAGLSSYNANRDYSDTNSYLYTKAGFWTMTPYTHVTVGYIQEGMLVYNNNTTYSGVRPVISLANGVMVTGHGTSTDPYKVIN